MKNTLETRLGVFFALALIAGVVLVELAGGFNFFKQGCEFERALTPSRNYKKAIR
jgi:hypothetical protein